VEIMSKKTMQLFQESPVAGLLGFQIDALESERCVVSVARQEILKRTGGAMHGGALATLADFACSVLLHSLLDGAGQKTVKVQINYLNPMFADRAVAEASIIKHGARISVVQVNISDENHEKIAFATITARH
jgi:uncharacterized protein (TIGR00369 family)